MTSDPFRHLPTAKINTTDGTVDLGFKVTPAFRQRYKLASALANVSMKNIMEDSFELWLEENKIKS